MTRDVTAIKPCQKASRDALRTHLGSLRDRECDAINIFKPLAMMCV